MAGIDQPFDFDEDDEEEIELGLPGVSFVIPCYNHGEFLEDAVFSCLNQQYPGKKEVIVVDDGSDDEMTSELIDSLPEEVIKVHHQANLGLAAARNTGFKLATQPYFLPLDADDMLHANYINATLPHFYQEDTDEMLGFVYTDVQWFGAKNGVWKMQDWTPSLLLTGPGIVCTNLMLSEMWYAVTRSNGYGYDSYVSQLGGWEDYLFYLEATALGFKGKRVPGGYFMYRKHAQPSMIDAVNAPERQEEIKKYIRNKMRVEYGLKVM